MTVEDSLASRLQAAARKRNLSFKQVVNEALRKGLQTFKQPPKTVPFRVKPVSMGTKPGVDYDKINQLLDTAEANDLVSKMKRRR